MTRLVWKGLAALLAGTALGVFVTWLTVFRIPPGGVNDGPWRTDLILGNPEGDAAQRAFVAVHGLFGLPRPEAIRYTARTDSEGQPLDGHCRYELTGRPPNARWWSITAYGPGDGLIANPANRYSVSSHSVTPDASGKLAVQIGGTARGDNWVPAGSGRFSLTLRLYNPGLVFKADPARAELPILQQVSCP